MKHYSKILLGTAICSSILLSGSAFGKQQAEPAKTQPAVTITGNKKEIEQNDLALAKFMFEHKNDAKAFEIFVQYANQGNAEAEAWLGRCYMNGIGTPVNHDKAFEYFSKAAEKNHPYGINGLGVCKRYGLGTDIDLQAAIEFYKKAADMNLPIAILNLAMTYSDKDSEFYDKILAEEYYKKAVTAGANRAKEDYARFLIGLKRYTEAVPLLQDSKDFRPLMQLAQCYENGWGVEVDIKKSLALMEEAYQLPDKSQWSAYSFYIAGLEENIINGQTELARHYFKIGAEQGDWNCQYEYALLLQKDGLINDAIKFMILAADQGYDKAQLEVGIMMMNQKDSKNAIKYLTLATLSNKTKYKAVETLSELYRDLEDLKQKSHWDTYGNSLGIAWCRNELALEKINSVGDENLTSAVALFALSMIEANQFGKKQFYENMDIYYDRLRILADGGNGNALFALGVLGLLYEKDHPNVSVGIELLEKAAKQKNAYACYILGNLYSNGVLIPKDLKKAIAWYRQGAELKDARCALSAASALFYDEKEFEKTSLEEFEKAFDTCIALQEYSVLYEYGQVMEIIGKDLKKAKELYRWAAEQGDARAMLHLHDLLWKNDSDQAINYLWQAVALEDSRAELRMGDIHRIGDLPRVAYSMYLQAYIHGDSIEAASRLAECWLTGYGCESNTKMFWHFANIAYEKGSSSICRILGNVYRDGKIIPRNLEKAKAYYSEGIKRGDPDCQKALDALK